MKNARNLEWQVHQIYQSLSDKQERDQAVLKLLNKVSKNETYIIKRVMADIKQADDGTYYLSYDPLRRLVL